MSDIPVTPSLSSGRRGIKDAVVENLNVLDAGVPLKYLWLKDSLKVSGRVTKHDQEGEGINLGVDIRSGGIEEGGMDLQLSYPTDAYALPAHILRVTKGLVAKFYAVGSDPSWPNERNAVVRGSVNLIQLINPVLSGLLSADLGDSFQQTYSLATMGATETVDPKPVNHRTGATKAYSATLVDGSALPAGVTINASTGVLTFTKASLVAGDYEIVVVATDNLATIPAKHPWRQLSCEHTLFLTVTA